MNVAQAVTIALAIGRARAQKVVGDRAYDTADRRNGRCASSVFLCRSELKDLVFFRRARAAGAHRCWDRSTGHRRHRTYRRAGSHHL